jgi:hypothetical protein
VPLGIREKKTGKGTAAAFWLFYRCMRILRAIILLLVCAVAFAPLKMPGRVQLPNPNVPKEYLDSSRGERGEPPLWVPEGTTNLAFKKPVTSSDKNGPIVGELSFVTDGDKDGDEGFEVELAPGLQWVQIDLQAQADIYVICIWHFHRDVLPVVFSMIVQISDDPEFKTGVSTVFNSDYEDTAGLGLGAGKDKVYYESNMGKRISVSGKKGRYVRLYSNGNHVKKGNFYVEVEVHGKLPPPRTVKLEIKTPPFVLLSGKLPVPQEHLDMWLPPPALMVPEGTENVARDKPVTSSDPGVGYKRAFLNDGVKTNGENAVVALAPGLQWVQIDLQAQTDIYAICVWHLFRERARAYYSVIVQISDDPEFKTGVSTVFNSDYKDIAGLGLGAGKDNVYPEDSAGKRIPVSGVKGRYVRLYSNGNTDDTGNHYIEVEVHGKTVKLIELKIEIPKFAVG